MKRADLLITISRKAPPRPSLQPASGTSRDIRTALEEAGFAVGTRVSLIATVELEKLLDTAWRYKELEK